MFCSSHQKHRLNVYGETTYGTQTCKQCFLTAYKLNHTPTRRLNLQSVENLDLGEKDVNFLNSISDPNNPLIDTISHFPSPGGEAIFDVSKSHLPMFNRENDIRPTEVPRFFKKVDANDEEFMEKCKSPWEQEEREPILTENELVDEKPVIENSLAEKTIADTEYARSLLCDKEKLRDIATKQFYKTSTQRMYEGVDWKSLLSPSRPPPLRPFNHDTRQLNHQIERYKDQTHSFQNDIGSWDVLQLRHGYRYVKPFEFCSISKKSQQIPNYQGSVCGIGEKDVLKDKFTPLTVVRTSQPKYELNASKSHIPGYTGCTLSRREPGGKLPDLVSVKHQRYATYPANYSRYSHQSPLSNTVSLTHPFVPYNKIDYSSNRTASGNRVY